MPLKISPSKRPLPVGKRSSLRNRSYEVEPVPGRKVFLSRDYPTPVRPPPLSDAEVTALQHSQIPPENATLILHDPVQSPPEVALLLGESSPFGSSWQTATSRRSARTLRRTAPVISALSDLSDAVHVDVMINPPPASAVTSTTSVVEASTPASAASSVSTVDNNPSVGLPS